MIAEADREAADLFDALGVRARQRQAITALGGGHILLPSARAGYGLALPVVCNRARFFRSAWPSPLAPPEVRTGRSASLWG